MSPQQNIAHRYKVIPIEKEGNVLTIAMKDPADIFSIDDIRLATGLEIACSATKEIDRLIVKIYGEEVKQKNPHLKYKCQKNSRLMTLKQKRKCCLIRILITL